MVLKNIIIPIFVSLMIRDGGGELGHGEGQAPLQIGQHELARLGPLLLAVDLRLYRVTRSRRRVLYLPLGHPEKLINF